MSEIIWSQEKVDRLNAFQHAGQFHPFTCGGNRGDEAHTRYAVEHNEDNGLLIATPYGWKCPVCSYVQDWAHDWM